MSHPAESTHWYSKDGEPAYEVEAAKGGMRPTTLRDARKLNLVPSVTTIIRCAAAPGLERWKQEQVLHAALTLPRLPNEPESDWIERVWADSREQGKKAAVRGTAIHAAIQGYYEEKTPAPEYSKHVNATETAIYIAFNEQDWLAEGSFAHLTGFGGKVDLSAQGLVVDFKTTEKPLDTIKTWDEHAMQLAAYREGLLMPQARCAIVYVNVLTAEAKVIELTEDELKQGWLMFEGLLDYWYAKTGLSR